MRLYLSYNFIMLLLFSQFISLVFAQSYILTPKSSTPSDQYNVLAQQFSLEPLASFESDEQSLYLYTTHHSNIIQHKSIISSYYHIEEDSTISLSNDFSVSLESVSNSSDVEIPWSLDRITKRKLEYDGSYKYSQPGSCHQNPNVVINTYVVDTGIDITHPQFQGRAKWSANFADSLDTDCNSHGTHVAGTIGSQNYGVCPDANLFAVKVLDCNGSGSLSGVIKGIEWVFNQHKKQSSQSSKLIKSIINMSLGGGYSYAINKVVEKCLTNDHFYIVAAAGNENQDACKTSPASAPSVLTVMASDDHDVRAYFSNWGNCADIYGPGVDILSTIPDGKTARYSGTSMSTPLFAGVVNHILDLYPNKNIKQVKKFLIEHGTKNIIHGEKPKTNNELVYLDREL
jgi:hypothetical protein